MPFLSCKATCTVIHQALALHSVTFVSNCLANLPLALYPLSLNSPFIVKTCAVPAEKFRCLLFSTRQEDALRWGLDVVVGTPGRLLDHVGKGTLQLSNTEFVILDEADQMLDMGFKEEMEKVRAVLVFFT